MHMFADVTVTATLVSTMFCLLANFLIHPELQIHNLLRFMCYIVNHLQIHT